MEKRRNKITEKIILRVAKIEPSKEKLTKSVATGVFLAFSPYLGFQTILVFILPFFLCINPKVTLVVLYTINNPWTFVPIIAGEYLFGSWLFNSVLNFNLSSYNPGWVDWINGKIGPYISPYLGIEGFDFWAFMLGGHIIAFTVLFLFYSRIKKICEKLAGKNLS